MREQIDVDVCGLHWHAIMLGDIPMGGRGNEEAGSGTWVAPLPFTYELIVLH